MTLIVIKRCHQTQRCSRSKTISCSLTNPTRLCLRSSSLELQMANNLLPDLFSQRSTVDALKLGRLTGRKHVTQLVERKKFTLSLKKNMLSKSLPNKIIQQLNVVSSYTRRCVQQPRTRSSIANMR